MTVWRVLINPTLWNLAKFRDEWTPSARIAQAKGKCAMKRVPRKGDLVKFVVKGFVLMTGIVETDGFRFGDEVALDECNVGAAPHREVNAYTWIKAIRFCTPEAIEWKGQRTWAVLPPLKRRLVRKPFKVEEKEEKKEEAKEVEEVCEDPTA
jgi:hypothetical protein